MPKLFLLKTFGLSKKLKRKIHTLRLRAYVNKCGVNCSFASTAIFESPEKIEIGDNCFLCEGVFISGASDSEIGVKLRDKVVIREYAYIHAWRGQIFVDLETWIGPYTMIYGVNKVTIGKYVLISGHTSIVPNNHVFRRIDIPIKTQGVASTGIVIEDDVWIGANCVILDGVTIGKGSVIGAGAVVNKNIPPYSIAVGVPAKVIKSRR